MLKLGCDLPSQSLTIFQVVWLRHRHAGHANDTDGLPQYSTGTTDEAVYCPTPVTVHSCPPPSCPHPVPYALCVYHSLLAGLAPFSHLTLAPICICAVCHPMK